VRGTLRNLALLAAGALLAAAGGVVPVAAGPSLVGRPAPAIRLPTADGSLLSWSDFRGQVVLVDFWASWCAPCRQSFPELNRLSAEFRARGFRVVAVNVDGQRKDADAFLAGRPRTIDVVFDPAGVSPKAFALQGMPASFLIGRDGNIRFEHVGYNDKVLAAYRREIAQLLAEPARGKIP
jgi:cytochrome c biogenesis protein CcmG, thiol:disulfide interchange protein DsbE